MGLRPCFAKQNPREILIHTDQETGRLTDALFVIIKKKNWKKRNERNNNPKDLSTGECISTFVIYAYSGTVKINEFEPSESALSEKKH